MQQVVKILPKRALFRDNLALYAGLQRRFRTAEREAQESLALERAGRRSALLRAGVRAARAGAVIDEAADTYETRSRRSTLGASWRRRASATSPLYRGPLRGRRADSSSTARPRISRRRTRIGRPTKLVALAYAQLTRGRSAAAIAAAEQALATSSAVKIRFLAARAFHRGGRDGERARADGRRLARRAAGRAAGLRARSSKASSRSKNGRRAARRSIADHRGEQAARHVDRPLRSRTRVSGRRRASRRPIRSSTAASSAAARRWRCSSTRSRPTATSRRSTTTRAACAKD